MCARAFQEFSRFINEDPGSRSESFPGCALDAYVTGLLERADKKDPGRSVIEFRPEEIGAIYEYLRGFEICEGAGGALELIRNPSGRRNQGLFFTPSELVKYIVRVVLDELDASGADLYSVRILDPAAGAGAFLVEATGQLAERLCASKEENPAGDNSDACVMHALTQCIYGVDIDETALGIARHALASMIANSPAGDRLNLRTHDILKGFGGHKEESVSLPLFGDFPEEVGVSGAAALFPEATSGFDAIIGNPPYEVLSAKESGITERSVESKRLRKMFRTAKGKLNTYRLMIEAAYELLKPCGILGFLVPVTFLADSSAANLRKMILTRCRILKTVVIPEQARLFKGVTQAVLILVLRKGDATAVLRTPVLSLDKSIDTLEAPEFDVGIIDPVTLRIPIIACEEDKRILELMSPYPPLRGVGEISAIASVHQGEVNLTTHREHISYEPTDHPLIRGEHIVPFRTRPSAKARLDWVNPSFFAAHGRLRSSIVRVGRGPSPWERERIACGRVVNMSARRRLKAALIPAGTLLGDMTCFLSETTESPYYLLGLLNSELMNRRFKLTSANNYLSAEEIASLPIPRLADMEPEGDLYELAVEELARSGEITIASLSAHPVLHARPGDEIPRVLRRLIVECAMLITASGEVWNAESSEPLIRLADHLTLMLFGAESLAGMIE